MKEINRSQRRSRKLSSFLSRSKFLGQSKLYPSLIIQGKWFADLGFIPGENVQINADENEIIIKKMEG